MVAIVNLSCIVEKLSSTLRLNLMVAGLVEK